MIRRPPRSTLSSSSAASDVYKRQVPCGRGERDDVDDSWFCVQDALGGHYHRRMAESGFSAFGESEVQIDEVTRRRHRARLSRRLVTVGRVGCRYGPVEALELRAPPYVPRSSRGPWPAA